MEKKFKVEGKCRGLEVNPEIVTVDCPENDTILALKERLRKQACLDEITAFEEIEG